MHVLILLNLERLISGGTSNYLNLNSLLVFGDFVIRILTTS
jgi:hypothetical protein